MEEQEKYILVIENDDAIPQVFEKTLEAVKNYYKLPVLFAFKAKHNLETTLSLLDNAHVIFICPNVVQVNLYKNVANRIKKRPVRDIILIDPFEEVIDEFCYQEELRDIANSLLGYGKRIWYGGPLLKKLVLKEALLFVDNYFSDIFGGEAFYIKNGQILEIDL